MSKKKTKSKLQNFEKKNISHINIFFNRTFRNFQKLLVKSLTLPIKHHKRFRNCEIENKMPKMLKK